MIAVLFAALSGLSYGASDFSGGMASKRSDPVAVTLAVQVVSLLSLAVVLVAYPRGVLLPVDLAWGALAGVGVAVGLSALYRALSIGPMSTAASITALLGSLIPVGWGLALGDIPNRLTLLGIALAIPAGVAVSVGGLTRVLGGSGLGPRSRVRHQARRTQTRRLSFVAGTGFGFFFVSLAQTSGDGGLHPLLGARFGAIATLIAVVVARVRRAGRGGLNRPGVARADGLVVAVAGLLDCSANSFYLLALEGGSLTWVAALVSLYPVATVLLARAVLSERIARVQAAGLAGAAGALVLVGIGAG